MAIPAYDALYPHVLTLLSDGRPRELKEITACLAAELGLSEDELARRGRSSGPVFHGRVGWACTYLFRSGLLERPSRGVYGIAGRGLEALESGAAVDNAYLAQFPEFREFTGRGFEPESSEPEAAVSGAVLDGGLTPSEVIEGAYASLRRDLEDALLERVRSVSPGAFEALVVDLLKRMYGGDFEDSSEVTGRTGDGGIDGIVRQDRLGFDSIYIQAKKWEGSVGRPEVQRFAGALQGRNASYGAFITSSSFTSDAREYALQASRANRIVLIDGRDLVRYMAEYGVGVVDRRTIVLRDVDEGYFDGLRSAWRALRGGAPQSSTSVSIRVTREVPYIALPEVSAVHSTNVHDSTTAPL